MTAERLMHVQEIQDWLRAHLFDQVPIAISIIDRNYNIVDANPRFEQSYGHWKGRPCYEVYKRRRDPCLNCAAAKTFEDGKVRIREEKGKVGDGNPTDYLVHMVPIRGPLGKIRFIVEMSTDISEVKKLETEKREAERLAAVGETVAGIAHGIKNVLMGLEGGMYAVNTGIRTGGRRQNRPGLDHAGRERQAHLRVREGVPGLRQGPEDHRRHGRPQPPAQEVVDLFGSGRPRPGFGWRSDLQRLGGGPLDEDGIHTCLANLVSNAIDACMVAESRREFVVTLSSSEEDGSPSLRGGGQRPGHGLRHQPEGILEVLHHQGLRPGHGPGSADHQADRAPARGPDLLHLQGGGRVGLPHRASPGVPCRRRSRQWRRGRSEG